MVVQAVDSIRALHIEEIPDTVLRAEIATFKERLNFAQMVLRLPDVVREVEDAMAKQERTKENRIAAQEGGSI